MSVTPFTYRPPVTDSRVQCGDVRELKLKTIGKENLAMLEFMEKESVLPARTKDKKKINGVEIDVHIAWHSCLYVTNFPESFDKAKVEEMFFKVRRSFAVSRCITRLTLSR